MHFHFCEALIRLFSQARRRKDSPLISAGGRLNSENSPVLLKYATVLGQINVQCRESTERVISQSALLLAARAPGQAEHTRKRSCPITVKLQIDQEVLWVRVRSQLTDSPVFHASVAVCENSLLMLLKWQVLGSHLYTISQTLRACRAMQLRVF